MPVPWLVPALMGVGQMVSNFIGQRRQEKHNKQIANTQISANEAYLDKQLEFNSPKNQMARYQEANLNPNLIYGQAGPATQSAPLQHPGITPTDMMKGMENVLPLMNQTSLAQSQVQANNASTIQKYAMVSLNKLQQKVLEKNPLLDKDGFNAIINSLMAGAELKSSESNMARLKSDWFTGVQKWTNFSGKEIEGPAGAYMLQRELELLDQKFNLGTTDLKIKAEILNSKEFQNAILEVQERFMTESEITPQHYVQFIQMLLMRALK